MEQVNKEAQQLSSWHQKNADAYKAEAATTTDPNELAMLNAEALKSQRQADYFNGLATEAKLVRVEEDFTVNKQA